LEIGAENKRGQNRVILNVEFHADLSEVFRYLGYSNGCSNVGTTIDHLVEEAYAEVRKYSQPRGIYRDFRLEILPESGFFLPEVNIYFKSGDLSNLWKDAEKITVIAATLGCGLDELVSDLLVSGQYTKAVIADAIGSAAAESAIEQVNQILKHRGAQEGRVPTPRFSPGYGDLPLEFQKEIISVLEANEIGIRITEGYMLEPRKSVTAMVAWLKPSDLDNICSEPFTSLGCDLCGYDSCKFRYKESRGKIEKG